MMTATFRPWMPANVCFRGGARCALSWFFVSRLDLLWIILEDPSLLLLIIWWRVLDLEWLLRGQHFLLMALPSIVSLCAWVFLLVCIVVFVVVIVTFFTLLVIVRFLVVLILWLLLLLLLLLLLFLAVVAAALLWGCWMLGGVVMVLVLLMRKSRSVQWCASPFLRFAH